MLQTKCNYPLGSVPTFSRANDELVLHIISKLSNYVISLCKVRDVQYCTVVYDDIYSQIS